MRDTVASDEFQVLQIAFVDVQEMSNRYTKETRTTVSSEIPSIKMSRRTVEDQARESKSSSLVRSRKRNSSPFRRDSFAVVKQSGQHHQQQEGSRKTDDSRFSVAHHSLNSFSIDKSVNERMSDVNSFRMELSSETLRHSAQSEFRRSERSKLCGSCRNKVQRISPKTVDDDLTFEGCGSTGEDERPTCSVLKEKRKSCLGEMESADAISKPTSAISELARVYDRLTC